MENTEEALAQFHGLSAAGRLYGGAEPGPQPTEFCSLTLSKLAAALAKAQATFEPIERTRTVTVRSDKGNYTFAYAPLDVVLAATMPSLTAQGLSLTSLIVCGGGALRTLLLHESGEFLAVQMAMPETQGPQKFGSALTYLRRYSIVALLGVASEEDDDGNAAEGNSIEKSHERPRGNTARAPQASASPPPQRQAAPPVTTVGGPAPQLALGGEVKQETKSSHGAERAEAADTIEQPQQMTEQQSEEIADLFKRAKFGRTAATDEVKKVTGKKGPFEMNTGDAAKLITHLKELLAAKGAGAAS